MKKLVLLASVSFFALSACNKSYTCKCASFKSNGDHEGTEIFSITGSKNQAQRDCKTRENVRGDVTTSCDLVD